MARSRTGSGGRTIRLLVAAAVVVMLVVAAGWFFVGPDKLRELAGRRSVVTIGISLAPDTTGTLVEVVGETADGSLPPTLDLELARADDATLTVGGPATGRQLVYSDVRDGLGNTPPADQVRAAHLRDVATDGRRVRLSFHVRSVAGRRIVYPIPRSPRLTWVRARLYVAGGTARCWGDAPSGGSVDRSVFRPCATPQPGEVDCTRHSAIRVELTAPRQP